MSFKIENFGADASNVKSILGGANYYRYFNKDNNTLTTPGYFPADLGLTVGDRIRVIPSVKTNPDEMYVVTSTTNRTITVTQIDTDSAVDSVNGKTGQVVLDASDVNAVAQLSSIPTASADNLGDIVQFIGTTDANYTNGYFYKCVSDGQEPATYSWTQVSVQPESSGLPDQTGQSGKFLTTDGTNASWSDKPLENMATTANALNILGQTSTATNYISLQATIYSQDAVGIGYGASVMGVGGIAIGRGARTVANYAIQLGGCNNATNSNANTLKFANANGNYEIIDANGTIPADRLASTTGLANGNYRQRLTMVDGVATITWVAE